MDFRDYSLKDLASNIHSKKNINQESVDYLLN